MDPMQMWLDELTIVHLGCIVEYGSNGRLKFIDVLNENEKNWSSESDFLDGRNQKNFDSNKTFVDNANTEDELQSRFDSRLQILDDLVAKMEAPGSRDQRTNEIGSQAEPVIRDASKRMIRDDMRLSPIPEEIPGYPENAAINEQDNFFTLSVFKRKAVAPRDEMKNEQKVSRENSPLLNKKRISWSGVKVWWSTLHLPRVFWEHKIPQNVIARPKLHVRDVARLKTPTVFTRFFLKRNKVKPAVC